MYSKMMKRKLMKKHKWRLRKCIKLASQDILLEVSFDLAEESVHLNILFLIKLLTDPRQAGQHHVHKPVRPNLQTPKKKISYF